MANLLDLSQDAEEKQYMLRLRNIEIADVRDQIHAFILKTVYQFTKTIK